MPSDVHALRPLLRVLYGLFSTRFAEWALARMLHTRADEPQAEQLGGTTAIVMGSPEMRIKVSHVAALSS